MRVAVDTNGLYTAQAGVARYIRGLLRGFRELQDPRVEIVPLAWEVENFEYRQPQRALKTFYRELFWAKWIAPSLIRKSGASLLHSTVNCLMTVPPRLPEVLTVQDVAFLKHPERFRRWQKWSWKRQLEKVPRAAKIICISQFTAEELRGCLELPSGKIEVIHLASDFDSITALQELPGELGIPSEFFLFVGSLEPGKNLALLREVYGLAAERGISLPPLVIVGARWLGVPGEGPPPRDWHYLGRQPDSILAGLYQRAAGLVFPSKYEGFGLPVAEAMGLGCPVICSPVASLPEVGGEAVLYAKLNRESYLEAMRRLAGDSAVRSELVERGKEQARKFSWRKCAGETLEVYRSVL
jgi:glycosyltransferase involved in cell wall biosynthesis